MKSINDVSFLNLNIDDESVHFWKEMAIESKQNIFSPK